MSIKPFVPFPMLPFQVEKSSLAYILNHELDNSKPNPNPNQKNRNGMRICDASPELLDIKRSEEEREKISPDKFPPMINVPALSNSVKGTSTSNNQFPNIHRVRKKNPYPKKSPSKSSSAFTDVFTTTSSTISSSFSDVESSPFPRDSISHYLSFGNPIEIKTRTKRKRKTITKRKRIGNSLTRLLADRGLLESIVTLEDLKSIRIPPPPSMPFNELMDKIQKLNLNLTIIQRNCPRIIWKGNPMPISHLPGYYSLLYNETQVVSTLRLEPIEYLTIKHILISTARRYEQRRLPFRKSDAQKLLRMDANKASKLWELFFQVGWI